MPWELCSYFEDTTVYTAPEQPTCNAITEGTNSIEISATQHADDVNAVSFQFTRDDLGNVLVSGLTSASFPYSDTDSLVPGDYSTVHTIYTFTFCGFYTFYWYDF